MKIRGFLMALFLAPALTAGPLQVDDLTPEELIGQTLVVRIDAGQQAPYKQAVKSGLIGTVLIKGGLTGQEDPAAKRAQTLQTIRQLRQWEKDSRHQIPLLIAFDYESGSVISPLFLGMKRLPSNMLLGAGQSQKTVRAVYGAAADEIRALGGQINFAPDLDVNTNPNNPIIGTRSFGAWPQGVAQNAQAAVKGLQARQVAAFAKHFPGHGDTAVDSHTGSPVTDLPLKELMEQHIAPFRAAIDAGIWGIMSSHVIYPALDKEHPATFSRRILTDLLRGELGFEGVIATDSLDMEGAKRANGTPQAVLEAYQAGADMPLIGKDLPYDTIAYIQAQYGKTLTPQRLKQSARRVWELKQKTGLFTPQAKPKKQTDFEKSALQAARRGVTLVKGKPFAKRPQSVCAVFFTEPALEYMLSEFTQTLEEARVKTQSVFVPMSPEPEELSAARACAKEQQTLVIGSYQKYGTPDAAQQQIINTLLKENPGAVFISLLSPYDLAFYPQAQTALALYGPTPQTLRTAAEILLGKRKAQGSLSPALRR